MFNNITPVVKALIAINIVFFIGTHFLATPLFNDLVQWRFHHDQFEYWQILTSMFMHSGLMHLAFNMYGLYLFGPSLEKWMGSQKFTFFYFAAGLGATLLSFCLEYYDFYNYISYLVSQGVEESVAVSNFSKEISSYNTAYSLGASGCVYGVFAGFATLYPNIKLQLLFIPVPIAAKWLIGAFVLYQALSTFNIISAPTGIGYAAHLGGAIVGFIMIWYWKRNSMDKYRWD